MIRTCNGTKYSTTSIQIRSQLYLQRNTYYTNNLLTTTFDQTQTQIIFKHKHLTTTFRRLKCIQLKWYSFWCLGKIIRSRTATQCTSINWIFISWKNFILYNQVNRNTKRLLKKKNKKKKKRERGLVFFFYFAK